MARDIRNVRNTTTSSGLKLVSGPVFVGPCSLAGVVFTSTANNSAIVVYNNANSASGIIVHEILIPSKQIGTRYSNLGDIDVYCSEGIFIELIGTGARVIIYYRDQNG